MIVVYPRICAVPAQLRYGLAGMLSACGRHQLLATAPGCTCFQPDILEDPVWMTCGAWPRSHTDGELW